jgi:hypothetical protein
MRGSTRFAVLAGTVLGATAVLFGILLGDRSLEAGEEPVSPWVQLAIGGSEVERYADFEEMAAAADTVVIARAKSAALSRTIQGDAAEDVVPMIRVDLVIDMILAGASVPSEVALEFVAPDVGAAAARERAAKIDAVLPDRPLLIFLRRKELGFHRAVNSLGFWEEVDGALSAPLALTEDAVAFSAGSGTRSFADIEALIANARPATT